MIRDASSTLRDRLASGSRTIALFFATWCPFCQAFQSTWQAALPSLPHPAVSVDVSHPKDPGWDAFRIETIPTVVLFDQGVEVHRLEASPGRGLDATDFAKYVERIRLEGRA